MQASISVSPQEGTPGGYLDEARGLEAHAVAVYCFLGRQKRPAVVYWEGRSAMRDVRAWGSRAVREGWTQRRRPEAPPTQLY